MARETFGETLGGWQELATSLAANADDLAHLGAHGTKLGELLKAAQDLITQQAVLTASKQEASKKLQAVIDEGRKVATFLRVGVKQHYGNRAEKLVEFGLRPFRSRRRVNGEPEATKKPLPPAATP